VNTFVIADVLDIHFARLKALSAVNALAPIEFYSDERKLAEEAVERSERANKAAEETENKDTSHDNRHKHAELPRKQEAESRIGKDGTVSEDETDRPFQRSRRADVFTEGRDSRIDDGDRDQNTQDHILQIGEDSRDPALFDFGGLDLIEKFLNKSERTQPTADGSAENESEQNDNAEYIGRRACTACRQRILQCADGTSPDRTGARITVESRNAQVFGISLVNSAVDEALDVRIR
jgi:hypothetical protein